MPCVADNLALERQRERIHFSPLVNFFFESHKKSPYEGALLVVIDCF
jgi:hypothetical protein